jgi:hypothetical protein
MPPVRSWVTRGALLVALSTVLLGVVASPAGAQAEDPSTGDAAQELAQRYAPIFMLKAQEEECDTNGESFRPMRVDSLLDNPQVALRQVGNDDPVVMWAPGAEDIYGLGKGFYLDYPGIALEPGCLYERDFRRYVGDETPAVYAHIATQADAPGKIALQYWTYWYYNDWNNKHESDWEFIQLVFEASTPEEALALEPASVGYAQHEGGEHAGWDSDKLEREGAHPVVYSSRGSHASYYGSALHMGRSGAEGFGCDNTDGPSDRIEPEVVLLPDVVAGADDPFAWLAFEGRWGERHDGPYNGPDGPYKKTRWSKPIDWDDDLRSSSVVVPSGDALSTQVVNGFCGVVEWGSVQVIQMQTSPARFVISLAVFVGIVMFILRRTTWGSVAPLPIVYRRRAGEIARASIALYRRHPVAFLAAGLIYLPLTLLAWVFARLVRVIPFVGEVASSADSAGGGYRLFLSLVVGGFTTLLAFVVVSAAIATMVESVSRGDRPSPRAGFARVRGRAAELAKGLLIAFMVVLVLELSVIGIPIGIWLLVRFQMLAQTTMLENLPGRAALARSSRLVRGRWFHTAIFVAIVHGLLATAGFVVGLIVLVTFTGLPFWALSVIVAFVSALVMPLCAIAVTLLYGDMVAERQGEPAEPAVLTPA